MHFSSRLKESGRIFGRRTTRVRRRLCFQLASRVSLYLYFLTNGQAILIRHPTAHVSYKYQDPLCLAMTILKELAGLKSKIQSNQNQEMFSRDR